MQEQFSFVVSQCRCLTDRQTDGQKCLDNTVHCISCSHTVKTDSDEHSNTVLESEFQTAGAPSTDLLINIGHA